MPIYFTPPSRASRLEAAGDTVDLPETMRRALEPGNEFPLLPPPGPADWLANHSEAGQTFEEFTQARPVLPGEFTGVLYLQPMGPFQKENSPSMEVLCEFLNLWSGIETRVLPPQMPGADVARRRNSGTGQLQLLSGDLVAQLRQHLPVDAFGLLGVTMTDLYSGTESGFTFGETSLADRVGVHSFARYEPTFYGESVTGDVRRGMLRRVSKALAHEVSHLLGIRHCIWYRCLMNGSNHLAEADARLHDLCPVDLRKLQRISRFDVAERYRRLYDFCRKARLEEETAWYDKRLRVIGGTVVVH